MGTGRNGIVDPRSQPGGAPISVTGLGEHAPHGEHGARGALAAIALAVGLAASASSAIPAFCTLPSPLPAGAPGTSGFAAPCGPSLFTSSGGGTGPYLLPALGRYLAAGYQGLGVSDGMHPYLVGTSESRSVLDATRTTSNIAGLRTANNVVIYGHSQGGHAALFAGEQAPTYAPELHVFGVVAAAPATGLSTLISIFGTPTGAQFLLYSIPTS